MRIALILLCYYPIRVAAYNWICSVKDNPIVNIETETNNDENGIRYLRQGNIQLNNAIIIPRGYIERQAKEDELDQLFDQLSNNNTASVDELNINPFDTTLQNTNNITESSNNNTIQGRRCTCGYMLPTEDEYYCPLPTDYCNIWSQPYKKGDKGERLFSVSCFVQPLGKQKLIVHNGHNPPFDLGILCSDCETSDECMYRRHIIGRGLS